MSQSIQDKHARSTATPSPQLASAQARQLFAETRAASLELIDGLSEADACAQSMVDASPAKWHLGHSSWFVEAFLLKPALRGYRDHNASYGKLFNSHFNSIGAQFPRAKRGILTRPSLTQVLAYGDYVDQAMAQLLAGSIAPARIKLVQLAVAHEQQHQELLLTDIKHLFAQNPLCPTYRPVPSVSLKKMASGRLTYVKHDAGLVEIGHDPANGFGGGFDCETPRHQAFVAPFEIASHPVTNGDWAEFIADGGYKAPDHWLRDGWARLTSESWQAPLYWQKSGRNWKHMTLHGLQPVDMTQPVCHISFYEADAYARWSGKRLPSEQEWEIAASHASITPGLEKPAISLTPAPASNGFFGDVWEWTSSPYTAYPGYTPAKGALGEYHGKFMSGQMVMRGGSHLSAPGHVSARMRKYCAPQKRWQVAGLRLAQDC
ncbi:MAG: ergothioneine biosynthesis protein EgtB [Parvularculaceae bacterium]